MPEYSPIQLATVIRDYETTVEPLLLREGRTPAAEHASHALIDRHGPALVQAALTALAVQLEPNR
ncbi:hypothetical protein [Streptomyces jumonjinensis]|uniref:hypothetical protein n=1 Tax=Streptomyces jumonjinensis TaxID=1945 RepID=UPI0037938B35